jgi:hypothetical protein
MELPEYLYSLDGEFFHEWDYIEDEIKDNFEPESRVTVFRGKPAPVYHIDYLKSLRIIESLIDIAADEDGEASEDYLMDSKDEHETELINTLNDKMIELGIRQPNFTRVVDVEEIDIEDFKW